MFTFIFAYFVGAHNQKAIFETNQKDLEAATEALSRILEVDLPENSDEFMQNVMNKSG